MDYLNMKMKGLMTFLTSTGEVWSIGRSRQIYVEDLKCSTFKNAHFKDLIFPSVFLKNLISKLHRYYRPDSSDWVWLVYSVKSKLIPAQELFFILNLGCQNLKQRVVNHENQIGREDSKTNCRSLSCRIP